MAKKRIPYKARKALAEGNVREANAFLRFTYSLTGTVIRGRQLGRVLGYPTANLKLDEHSPLFLANGVYAVKVEMDKKIYHGMANVGIRPTLDQHELTVEVNIFDFSMDIYEREITIFFIDYLREEKKFENLEALKTQIGKDKERVLKILSQGM